jgi:hypothetical protein
MRDVFYLQYWYQKTVVRESTLQDGTRIAVQTLQGGFFPAIKAANNGQEY